MDTVVYLLAGMAIIALGISVFVFAAAARSYVSETLQEDFYAPSRRDPRYFVKRSGSDRRCAQRHDFPFEVNGIWIESERRTGRDRRSLSH